MKKVGFKLCTLLVSKLFLDCKFVPVSCDKLLFPLIQNSKFNNFLWVCWFLCNTLSNFVPPAWKIYNPYYHNAVGHARVDFICKSKCSVKNLLRYKSISQVGKLWLCLQSNFFGSVLVLFSIYRIHYVSKVYD